MFTIRVEAWFAAAHFLTEYHGKCEHLHGHNYKVRVYARGTMLDSSGMLTDFGDLKAALRKVLLELDHSNLNDNPAFEKSPSAERIARFVFTEIKQAEPSIPLSAVEVFETETSMARYEPD